MQSPSYSERDKNENDNNQQNQRARLMTPQTGHIREDMKRQGMRNKMNSSYQHHRRRNLKPGQSNVIVGIIPTNQRPISIHLVDDSEISPSKHIKNPHSPLSIVNQSIVPEKMRYKNRKVNASFNDGNSKQHDPYDFTQF